MRRPDRGTLRSAGFVLLLATVFVVVNSQVVYAAGTSTSESGDLLAPLNIASSEGVPINGYELNASGGSIVAFKTQALAFALSGLFTLIRLLVGLAGWAIELAFRFPLLKILIRPAQKVADSYNAVVVDALGLKGLLLAWAFVFAGFMIVRGKVGRGLGEILLTLLIAAFAASAFVRPDYLLSQDGPLGQGQQVASEVAQQSVNSYDWGGKLASRGPCDGMAGNAELKCLEREGQGPVSAAEVARPIQDSITNALVVKPYMLLQYGRILDPAKASDTKAYAIHLKWVTGGYKASAVKDDKDDPCGLVHGSAKKWCEREEAGGSAKDSLPDFTPGGQLLDTVNPVVSEEDQEFAAFLSDLKKAGPVGKSCAAYAEKPTWWRVGGAGLLMVAALFICGMLLSAAIVLLATQGICAAAAAVGGITFVAAMLPGPPRQSVWKWLSVWGISVLTLVGICAFIPFFGIAVDATITNGPDLMVERILLIDVLAIAGAAGHRRLLTGITSFGQRMAMRMRYATVGGTHMPGDTSELGAALAMNVPTGGAYGGGLRSLAGGRGGRFAALGTRQRLMTAVSSLVDGTGMPVNPGRILSDATAEAGRGLAPLTAAAAVGALGARVGGQGVYGLLIGRRPDREQLAKWQKPTADGDSAGSGPDGPSGPSGPSGRFGGMGPRRPSGPPDRYRTADGQVIDRTSGGVLHDQNTDRTLLSTRAHKRLVRFRGYRILNRSGRAAYGATVGLPATVRRAGGARSQYTHDVRQQRQVWWNTLREDGRAWGAAGLRVQQTMREKTDDRGAQTPFTSSRRLSSAPSPATASPAAVARPSASQPVAPSSAARPSERPDGPAGSAPRPQRRVPRLPDGARLPGVARSGVQARNEARERMRALMRRTEPAAERLRQEREQQGRRGVSEDGQGEDE
ncbi:hypothetical protein ACFYPT_38640 [Streptomyces sp. NPDC005529]|uniref:hypothetical protein n=1 Tax=unclassified Streptomyces TaxID=2593676 RepID=UPI0033B4E352